MPVTVTSVSIHSHTYPPLTFSKLQNLTLWHGGDELILTTASQCANTIVVLHTVGPVLVEDWYDHPNVTAILYASLPGQESGNSLLDVLIGTVNPWVLSMIVLHLLQLMFVYESDLVVCPIQSPNSALITHLTSLYVALCMPLNSIFISRHYLAVHREQHLRSFHPSN